MIWIFGVLWILKQKKNGCSNKNRRIFKHPRFFRCYKVSDMGERLDELLDERAVRADPTRLSRRVGGRPHPRQPVRETAEQVAEREVAAWYEGEYGKDRKYLEFALDLMEKTLEMDVSDAARLQQKVLPAYIERRKPEIIRRIKDKAKSGQSSRQGVIKALDLLNAVQSIVARKITPAQGIQVVDGGAGYEPASDGNGGTPYKG
jgi:hypothetical protein